MRIRRATADDAAALSDLAGRTFALACPPGLPPEAIAEHIATKLTPQQFAADIAEHEVIAAFDGDLLVGYAMVVRSVPPVDTDWADPVEVRRIYVDEHLHGQGLAGDLMAACLAAGAAGGHDWIWLGTNQGNERALRFYRKHGFGIIGRRTFEVGPVVEVDFVLARPVHTVEA